MKERPIIFSGKMVRAILDGRKTQTRRIVKLHDFHSDYGEPQIDKAWIDDSYMEPQFGNVPCLKIPYGDERCVMGETVQRYFPKWEPGERLWVKETHSEIAGKCYFRASLPYGNLDCHFKPWKPSIFMPRKLSRITIEITAVRVQRLQDITEQDAIAEGMPETKFAGFNPSPKDWYRQVWESINGPDSWAANPWVWVIEFKKL